MEAKRLTMTRFFAMCSAPRDKVTDTTIGSSSGVRPTASATANRKDSSHGLCSSAFTKQHEQHQQDGEAHDEQAEAMRADFEGGWRRLATNAVGDGSDGRAGACFHHTHSGAAADDACAHEHSVGGVL